MNRHRFFSPAVAMGLGVLVACGTESTPKGLPGGPVSGAADSHCGAIKQPWSQAACQKQPVDAGAPVDADISDASTDGPQKHEVDAGSEYGPALYGTTGADDDCKFDFSWTSTPIYRNENVTFTVDVFSRFDGATTVGANPYPEIFLDATHSAPVTGTVTKDLGGGRYSVGPVRFDRAGRWTVRFHVYDGCIDGPESPHSHVAFFVDVP